MNISDKNASAIEKDLLAPVRWGVRSKVWLGFLIVVLSVCMFYYFKQLRYGLGVTGLRDIVSWGLYISNFVFFVAASLIGMLISSVLGLIGYKWIIPVSRIAEIIAVSFSMVAGLVIITDMGRPERLLNVLFYGRVQSPIVWDIVVVTTYVAISLLLLYVPLIPDIALCKEKKTKRLPRIQLWIYKVFSLGWAGTDEQFRRVKEYIRILAILVIPVALAIHTVTSWLFAMTLRPGWDYTIFGPYFVSGAFVAGCAAVIIAMFFFRRSFNLADYITDKHFDKMGKLLVLVALVYVYFNLNELFVPAYKLKSGEAEHLQHTLWGAGAFSFWLVQAGGLVIPIILLLIPKMRKPLPSVIISVAVLAAAWYKRYLIVIPVQEHPYLPAQNVPDYYIHYTPTVAETAVTIAPFILVLILITLLSKMFPVIPVWEVKEEAFKKQKD